MSVRPGARETPSAGTMKAFANLGSGLNFLDADSLGRQNSEELAWLASRRTLSEF